MTRSVPKYHVPNQNAIARLITPFSRRRGISHGMVRVPGMAGRPPLPAVWMYGDADCGPDGRIALLLHRLPGDVLRQDRDGVGAVQGHA